jgi:hypothetical protein
MLDLRLETLVLKAHTRGNGVRMHQLRLNGKVVYQSLFHFLCTRVQKYLLEGGSVQYVEEAAAGEAPPPMGGEPEEESFEDLLHEVSGLAAELCFDGSIPLNTALLYGEEISDTLWAYAEGGVAKYHMDRINGRCSLKESMEYDMEQEEQQLKDRRVQFRKLLEKREAGDGAN